MSFSLRSLTYVSTISYLVGLGIFVTITFTGCSSSEPDLELSEIPTTEAPILDGPEVELLENGKRYFQLGLYDLARENFQSLVNSYPLSEHLLFAETKVADTFFLQRNYAGAAVEYEELYASYPAASVAPYLLLQTARSYELMVQEVGRDRGPTEQALKKYEELIQRYPNSGYVQNGYEGKRRVLRSLELHEQMIADFYEKLGNEKAAQRRRESAEKLRAQIDSSPTPPTERAVLASLQADFTLPALIVPEASDKSRKIDQSTPLPLDSLIRSVDCRKKNQQVVTLELKSPVNTTGQSSYQFEKAGSTSYNVTLPFLEGHAMEFNCFGSSDLKISETGELSLQADTLPVLFITQFSPRIVIVVPE